MAEFEIYKFFGICTTDLSDVMEINKDMNWAIEVLRR